MNSEQQEKYRGRLGLLRAEIQADLKVSKEASEIVELDTSIGRLSRMDAMQNQQMALELRRRQEQQLQRIANAFKRMDKGTYGSCGKCKQPISEDRLEVSPDVVMCVRCA